MSSARLVRRRPISERLREYADLEAWLLWFGEELNSGELEESLSANANLIGIIVNVIFIVARANSTKPFDDTVFGEDEARGSSGWFRSICRFTVLCLSLISLLNTLYTFWRRKHYRLFEQPIETVPATPSARRVRIDSSPSAFPIQSLYSALAPATAESRAYPDQSKDVWEVSVWDPTPVCLKLFCYFSPAHVIMYTSFLPVHRSEATPSLIYVKVVLLAGLLWAQGSAIYSWTERKFRDVAIINKEVFHEYDTKFVHPSLNRPVRDVAVQTPAGMIDSSTTTGQDTPQVSLREVDVYTPHTVINRGWRVSPNPSYSPSYDPDNSLTSETNPRLEPAQLAMGLRTPRLHAFTPTIPSSTTQPQEMSSPIRQGATQPRQRSPTRYSTGAMPGDGGSLGVYSHANSPLRKSASHNALQGSRTNQQNGVVDRFRRLQREGSPLKKSSVADVGGQGRASSNNMIKDFGGGSAGLERRLKESGRTRNDR